MSMQSIERLAMVGLLATALLSVGTPARAASQASQRWNFAEPSVAVPRAVSIGNHGTEVFSATEGAFGAHARLLSSHDSDPALAVWENSYSGEIRNVRVASSGGNNIHALLQMKPVPGSGQWQAVVRCYVSSSVVPRWEWTFPVTFNLNTSAALHVTESGGLVVAAIYLPQLGESRIVGLHGSSGALAFDQQVPTFGGFGFSALSGNEQMLYLAKAAKSFVLDFGGSGEFSNVTTFVASQDGHAITEDGSRFFVGGLNSIRTFDRLPGGSYGFGPVLSLPGVESFCHRLALSADGRYLVGGFLVTSNVRDLRLAAWDLSNGALIMNQTVVGGGSFSNDISGLGFLGDSQRFAVSQWGDQAGLLPDLSIWQLGSSQPEAQFHLQGSAMGFSASEDGDWVVIAQKSVHSNTPGGGGTVKLFSTRAQDLLVTGIPSSSGPPVRVSIQTSGAASAVLLSNFGLEPVPLTFPAGTLYVQRDGMLFTSSVPAGAGSFVVDWNLAASGLQVGQTLFLQGLALSPRALTTDWATLTVLP